MAGPIVGSIEHLTSVNGTTGSIQSQFVNVYRFLLNASSSLGVTRLAYNTGSSPTGLPANRVGAMNYHDEALPAGPNAWAVFRFNNATIPFDVLVQYTPNGTQVNANPASPGLLAGSTQGSIHVVLFAFAQRLDGATAWNGTTLNNGQDAKGSTVWTTGSNVPTFFAPRSNAPGLPQGAFFSARSNMLAATTDGGASSVTARTSMVADYDNFTLVVDASNDTTYTILHFGKLIPISGSSVDIPYFCFSDRNAVAWPVVATAYGSLAGTTTTEGGIMFPVGSASGTLAAGFDRLGTTLFQNVSAQPNRAYSVPTFNEFPLNVGMNEDADHTGLIGQSDGFIRDTYNLQIHDTNAAGTRAVFGGVNTTANIKVSIPWHSGTAPGSGVARSGVQFSNP